MRFVVGTLALLGVGAISLALADPSTTAPAPSAPAADAQPAPTATAPQTAPAAAAPAATPAAAPAKPTVDPEEKRLLAEGYKPEMRNGQKVYCKREEELGTRLGGVKICGTPAQLQAQQTETRENVEKMQRTSGMPVGK